MPDRKPQPSESTIAVNLPILRAERRMTQAQLADIAEMSQSYVTKIEKGDGNITLATLDRIARALDVAPAILISRLTVESQAQARMQEQSRAA